MKNSCRGFASCNGFQQPPNRRPLPDNSVGMDKRKDILEKGHSKEVISRNIAKEINSGRQEKQAIAIAFSEARRKDLLPTNSQKATMQNYGVGTLRNTQGNEINSPSSAKQLSAFNSNQSYDRSLQGRKKSDRYGITKK